jgi:hypothetical protein
VLFMPAQEMPFEDLDDLEKHGWAAPSDSLFPLFAKVSPPRTIGRLLPGGGVQ